MFALAVSLVASIWHLVRVRMIPKQRDFVIVKLGGSAITKKSQRETLLRDALNKCAAQLGQVKKKKKNVHMTVLIWA